MTIQGDTSGLDNMLKNILAVEEIRKSSSEIPKRNKSLPSPINMTLYLTLATCSNCGHVHALPAKFPIIKTTEGSMNHINALEMFKDLPKVLYKSYISIDICHLCFDPDTIEENP